MKYMNKILEINEVSKTTNKLREQNKSIVLTGGFFDILHLGHIKFLQKAKEKGDILIVLLESDETAKKTKGENRPVNNQLSRAEILASLSCVDFIIKLPYMKFNKDYDDLIQKIYPSVLAITKDDPYIEHKKRQAAIIGGKVVSVISRITDKSTSRFAKIIEKENNL